MKRKRISISTIILLILFLVGLSVMLYPIFSNWWNSRVQTHAIANYDQAVQKIDTTEKDRMFENAEKYNEALSRIPAPFTNCKDAVGYDEALNISGTGIMGYVTIPKINVSLPIYHGTSVDVLNVAVGHIEGSSLPIGGKSRHTVLSAHRGLPTAKLFTDIDQLAEGDTFTITIIDKILTYEVDKISIVLPSESDKLAVVKGQDLATLMTCTPYGVNTHRLLVRGHRVETVYPNNIKVSADAAQVDNVYVIAAFGIPLLIMLIIYWLIPKRRNRGIILDELIAEELMPDIDTEVDELNGV